MAKTTLPRTAPRSVPRGRGTAPSRPSRDRGLPLPLVAVAVLVAAAAGWIVGRPSSFERQVAALEGESVARDVDQVAELVTVIGETRATILDPLGAMHAAMPREGTGPVAAPDEVEVWAATLEDAGTPFDDPPSGLTGTNVARNTLRSSVEALHGSVTTYRLALDTRGATRDGLLTQAGVQRDLGVQLWDTGIMQLDERSHATGGGHHHGLVLPQPGRSDLDG